MRVRTGAFVVVVALGGCTTGQVGTGPNVAPATKSFVLKLAVGTATIGLTTGASKVGLNVVASFRQSNAQNATLTNTPTLSGPALFAGAHSITGVTQAQMLAAVGTGHPPLVPNSLFGPGIGVFGYGLAPLNFEDTHLVQSVYNSACTGLSNVGNDGITYFNPVLPYVLANPCAGTASGLVPQQYNGGPPAWPSPQGYGLPTGFAGYPLGFVDFYDVVPVSGQYALDVAYSINATATQYAHVATTARLTSTGTPLPYFPAPTLQPQNDGSALVNVNVPAGVTEAIVLVSNDACQRGINGTTLPTRYYSLLTRAPGPQTLLLSSKFGPPDSSGHATDTFCTAADDALPNATTGHRYSVSAVGFDYPAFEASYPQSTTPSPILGNAAGQADLTSSSPPLQSTPYQLLPPT